MVRATAKKRPETEKAKRVDPIVAQKVRADSGMTEAGLPDRPSQPVPLQATSPAEEKPAAVVRTFTRKKQAPDASTPDLYREALGYEGKTDERTFRSVALRLGCRIDTENGRLAMRGGRLLMGRFDPKSGKAETRHDFPHPAPLRAGSWEIEVRDAVDDEGRTPFGVRWTSRGTGQSFEIHLLTDLDGFIAKIRNPRTTITVTDHEGTRRVVTTVARSAWEH